MASVVSCPRCGIAVALHGERRPPEAPFCSERCRLLDLGAWSEERYVVARPLDFDDLDIYRDDS